MSEVARPFLVTFAERYSPFAVVTRSSLETSTPAFLAKACAAGVGWPSLKATLAAGPLICSVTSGCAEGIPGASTPSLRGVSMHPISPEVESRSRFSRSATRCCNSSRAPAIIRAGISSVPISSRKSGISFCTSENFNHRGHRESRSNSSALREPQCPLWQRFCSHATGTASFFAADTLRAAGSSSSGTASA